MFKRRAVDLRIFPSEPAAPSLPSPVPDGPAATSSAAEFAYLHSDGVPHEVEQPSMISASRSNPLAVPSFANFVGYPSSVDLFHMILVEEMDRTLKAWVQQYEDVNLEVLPVLEEILGTLDIMLRTRERNPTGDRGGARDRSGHRAAS